MVSLQTVYLPSLIKLYTHLALNRRLSMLPYILNSYIRGTRCPIDVDTVGYLDAVVWELIHELGHNKLNEICVLNNTYYNRIVVARFKGL